MLSQKQIKDFRSVKRGYKTTDFISTIYTNDYHTFSYYLDEVPDLNISTEKDRSGTPVINIAIEEGIRHNDTSILELIIKHKTFNVNDVMKTVENSYDAMKTPLFKAAKLNNFKFFTLLESAGFRIDTGRAPFELKELLTYGIVRYNITEYSLDLAFHIVNQYSSFECLDQHFLFSLIGYSTKIKNGESIYTSDEMHLFKSKASLLFKEIYDRGAYKDENSKVLSNSLVYLLANNDEYDWLSLILNDHPKDINLTDKENTPKSTALFLCIEKQKIDMLKWFIDNYKLSEPVDSTGRKCSSTLFLLEQFEKGCFKKDNALNRLYKKHNEKCLSILAILVSYGFSCHTLNHNGVSAYSKCLKFDIPSDFKIRILNIISTSHDFDVNKISGETKTVYSLLNYLPLDSYKETFKWLKMKGADINHKDMSSLNALIHSKSKTIHIEMFALLYRMDSHEEYFRINKESVIHTLIKSQRSSDFKEKALVFLIESRYIFIHKDTRGFSCIDLSNEGISDKAFIDLVKPFYLEQQISATFSRASYKDKTNNKERNRL